MERIFEYLYILSTIQQRLNLLEETGYDFKVLAPETQKSRKENETICEKLERFEKWKRGDLLDLWAETVKYQNISHSSRESSDLEMEHKKEGVYLWQEKEILQKL
jgi:hypothetical protein